METLAARLNYREKAIAGLDKIPPFSPILHRLMATLAKEDVSFAELARIIEQDTVLAGNVLRIVNSALYGMRGTVNSVARAISLLGLQKLRNFALGLSISKIWIKVRTPAVWSTSQFNLHSVSTALLADQIAVAAGAESPENAFAAGLFHDFGKLMIAMSLPDEYNEIHRLWKTGGKTIELCEEQVLGFDHTSLSAEAVSRWRLPGAIHKAVLTHHAPVYEKSPLSLGTVIGCASHAAESAGIATECPPTPRQLSPEGYIAKATDFDKAQQIWSVFQSEFDAMRRLL